MKKQKRHAFGKDIYLLGKNKDGRSCWLEAGRWNCDCFWGFGYVNTYTNKTNPESARDLESATLFDILFLNDMRIAYETFETYFQETPLSDTEIWKLLELMETFYLASSWSGAIHRGGSNISENSLKEIIKSNEEYERINKVVIPAIMEKVYEILSPKAKN